VAFSGSATHTARPAGASDDDYGKSLARAYASTKAITEGKNADYIPALAAVDSALFGVALVTVTGELYEVGDTRSEFSIQSVSKIFTLARAIDLLGRQAVEDRIGVNATGLPFNSIIAIELNKSTHPAMNPLVNAGALATVALLPETNPNEKWNGLIGSYSAFAARRLGVNEPVYQSESATNTRNRAIATLLQAYEVIKTDPGETLDLYTRQCSVNTSAKDLAVMGATLANGGKNPLSGEQVVKSEVVSQVLAVMATAGLYETTGQWVYRVGVPAKSGVGGGIVAVVPGAFAIGTFSPPLDEAGNSVRGQAAIASILQELGVNLYASQPVASSNPSAAPPLGTSAPEVSP
jgi:glutaminase